MAKRILVLGGVALYALALTCWLSSRHLMVLDEFFAWNLLSDPSWHHAMASWNGGADSGGILYYALLWPLVRLSHGSVLVARLFSCFCYVAAAVLWWRALSRFLGSRSAALGVLLVWLSSGLLLVYIAQVRFYTPFLLFAALAGWTTLRCADDDVSPWKAALLVAGAHTCLVLIHMLGVLYSALIVAAVLLSVRPWKRSLLLAASGVISWLALLPCRTAIHNGSANATSQAVPVFRDLVRFHVKSSASAPVLLVALLGLVWFVREQRARLNDNAGRAPASFKGPILTLAFLASPYCLYLLSNLGRPLGATRYLLPYYLSLGTLCAYGFHWLLQASSGRRRDLITAAGLLLALALHVVALRSLPHSPTLQLGQLGTLAAGKPVVVADEQTFFQLQYYRSNKDLQFYFLLPSSQEHPVGMMATVAARGYFQNNFSHTDAFKATHPEFFFLSSTFSERTPWVTQDPTCRAQQVGTVSINSVQARVYHVTGCKPAGTMAPQV